MDGFQKCILDTESWIAAEERKLDLTLVRRSEGTSCRCLGHLILEAAALELDTVPFPAFFRRPLSTQLSTNVDMTA